ncbi:MAG TPA: hypothetical protein VKT99_15665 [Xanthobacteraceae bacterium]|nr:hypothetical protein [Xanthobacteraceae bacterium]
MSLQNDDFDEETEAAIDELERHGMTLHQLIQDYVDKHDLSDEMTSLMLLDISIRMRMVGYALEAEKPSASGLKLDLDRFRGDIDDYIRAAKKNADQFVAEAKTLRAEAEREIKDELDDERGAPS